MEKVNKTLKILIQILTRTYLNHKNQLKKEIKTI